MLLGKNHGPDILPDEFAAIFAMGENFFTQGQFKKAQVIFYGLMALDAHNQMASIAYGESLLMDGQYNKALAHFLNASKSFPANFRALLGGAKACLLLGRNYEARDFLTPILVGQVKVIPDVSREIRAMMARIETK